MGNKNLSACSNYLYCMKSSKDSTSVINSDVNIQKLSTIQPSSQDLIENQSSTPNISQNLNNNSNNNINEERSLIKNMFIYETNNDEAYIESGQPQMNIHASSKTKPDYRVHSFNCYHEKDNNNKNIHSPSPNININLNKNYVINYINNTNSSTNNHEGKINFNNQDKKSVTNGAENPNTGYRVLKFSNDSLNYKHLINESKDQINKNVSRNVNDKEEKLGGMEKSEINSFLSSFKYKKDDKVDNKLNYQSIISLKDSLETLSKTVYELKFNSEYKVHVEDNDKIALYTYINIIKKIQSAYRKYMSTNQLYYESKSSIGNVSNIFREDKLYKVPPEVLKGFKINNDSRKSVNTGNSEIIHLNITKLSGESKKNNSNQVSPNKISNASLNCRLYKLKADNKLIKKIKNFILKNINEDGSTLINNYFGVKQYSNESKIIGTFNSNNEADGIAVYQFNKSCFYLGK